MAGIPPEKSGKKRRPLLNWANGLTLARFAAAPIMVGILLALRAPAAPVDPDAVNNPAYFLSVDYTDARSAWAVSMAAFVVLGLALLTDMFDGWVARRMGIVTDFGKIMDPVADSTLSMTVLFALAACPRFRDHFPVWIPLVVLYREVAMQVLRRYGALRGKVMAARWAGKIKMGIQSVAMAGFFLMVAVSDLRADSPAGPWLDESTLGCGLFWIGVLIAVVNVASLGDYLRDASALLAEYHDDPPRDPA